MSRVIEIFKELCAIPHCSGRAGEMRLFLKERALALGYEVDEDAAGNLLARKGTPRVCLQAHYDMVCIGEAERMVVVEREGYVCAEGSSLGADNGIGMAYMLTLMEEGAEVECLFTSDEEIGLVGANALELKLRAHHLINLDNEEEKKVAIGCAGGYDLEVRIPLAWENVPEDMQAYRVRAVQGFPGGHSGIDIHKGIPSAIVELAITVLNLECALALFEGGEKMNAIPAIAEAVVLSPVPLVVEDSRFLLEPCEKPARMLRHTKELLERIRAFPQGVRAWNEAQRIAYDSVSLGVVRMQESTLRITLMGRANTDALLEKNLAEVGDYWEKAGAIEQSMGHRYCAWEPEESPLARRALEVVARYVGGAEYLNIHTGFECGVLKGKFPHMEMVAIGPNIHHPHSRRERVEIASVLRIERALRELIGAL